MESLNLGQGISKLPLDDAKLQAFMRPPRTPSPPDTRSPSSAPRQPPFPTSFPRHHQLVPGHPFPGTGNGQLGPQAPMGAQLDEMRQAWEDEMAELQLHDRSGSGAVPWVADFADRLQLQAGPGPHSLAESAWAAESGNQLQLGHPEGSQVTCCCHAHRSEAFHLEKIRDIQYINACSCAHEPCTCEMKECGLVHGTGGLT